MSIEWIATFFVGVAIIVAGGTIYAGLEKLADAIKKEK